MRFIVSRNEACLSASEVVKFVTIIHAVKWVAETWKTVSQLTVKQCFCKAGIYFRARFHYCTTTF